jgi:hypothetical protein
MGHGTNGEASSPSGVNEDFVFCRPEQDAEVDYQSNPSLADIRKHTVWAILLNMAETILYNSPSRGIINTYIFMYVNESTLVTIGDDPLSS